MAWWHPPGFVIGFKIATRYKCVNELLHEFNRMAQQQMILAGTVLDAKQQLIILLHQRQQERAVISGQPRNNGGEGCPFFQTQLPGHVSLMLSAFMAHGCNDVALRIALADILQELMNLTLDNGILLLLQHGEHFAILLQFLTQGFNQVMEQIIHGCLGAIKCGVTDGVTAFSGPLALEAG